HLSLQDLTSHAETFWRPILTSDPYSISEMQREEQERHLSLQDITSHTGIFRRPILPILPVVYSEKVVQSSLVSNAFPNAHLANIVGIIRSLRTGDDMRHTSGLDFFDSIRHLFTSERSVPLSNPDTLWQHTYENLLIFGPPLLEWRSHTDDAMALGNSTETVFRSNASGGYYTAPTGPKTLRTYKE
ncbi:10916_t:CDS:2, partial [Dentiscutata erythropus]